MNTLLRFFVTGEFLPTIADDIDEMKEILSEDDFSEFFAGLENNLNAAKGLTFTTINGMQMQVAKEDVILTGYGTRWFFFYIADSFERRIFAVQGCDSFDAFEAFFENVPEGEIAAYISSEDDVDGNDWNLWAFLRGGKVVGIDTSAAKEIVATDIVKLYF
jgi:hypothetical protein